MKIDGQCHCGAVTYEAEINPEMVGICHCTDCQSLSGSAFRTIALTEKGSFKLLSGDLTIYVKTGESGAQREQAFCPTCGSPIYSAAPGDEPRVHSVRFGTVSQRAQLPPRFQIWQHSALPWLDSLSEVPANPKQ